MCYVSQFPQSFKYICSQYIYSLCLKECDSKRQNLIEKFVNASVCLSVYTQSAVQKSWTTSDFFIFC